jgi:hypothetical protein
MRALAIILTVVLVAGVLAACSASPPQDRMVVTLAHGLTISLKGGTAKVEAEASPASVTALLARRLPVRLLAQPERIIFAGKLPAGGAVLTWRINRTMVAPGVTPFIAALEQTTGQWTALPGSYNRRTGIISARVSADPVVAPLGWVNSQLRSMLQGAFLSIFGLSGTGTYPQCSSYDIPITDSHPAAASIGFCAQPAGSSQVLVKLASMRPYPVDVTYPAGTSVSPSVLSRLITQNPDQAILFGLDHLDATVPLNPGQSTRITVRLDKPAFLAGILGMAETFASLLGGKAKAVDDVLESAKCMADDMRSLNSAASLTLPDAQEAGSTIMECAGQALGDSKDVAAVIATAVIAGASIVGQVIFAAWATVDKLIGDSDHVLTVQRPFSPGQSSPASFPIQYPGDMTLACIQQYGQGTQASWVDTVSPPSYGVQCFQGSSLLGGLDLDEWCPAEAALHHYSSPAGWYSDNPYRYSAATNTIKPWTTWRCYQR